MRVSNSASISPPTVTTQPTRTVTIENNDIFDFQSNGVFLTADEGFSGPGPAGQTANLVAYVRNNRITGSGPQTVAQNGIQIGGILGFEPNSTISGAITGNTISNFWYTIGTVATDSAILSVAKTTSSGMQITGNTITNAQVGIHSSWSATISGNTINWTWTTVPPGCRGSAIQLSYYYAVAPDLGPAMTFIVRNNLIYYDNVGIEINVALAPGYVFEENSLNVYTGWPTPSGAVAIANYTSTAILANNNYWGQASGPLPIECCGPVTVTTHITTPTTTPGPGFWPTTTPTEPVPTLSEWSLMLLGLLLVLTAGWMMSSDRSRRARAER